MTQMPLSRVGTRMSALGPLTQSVPRLRCSVATCVVITGQQEGQRTTQTWALEQSFRWGPCGNKIRGEELVRARVRAHPKAWEASPALLTHLPSVRQPQRGWRCAGTAARWQTADQGSLFTITNEVRCRAACESPNSREKPCRGHGCAGATGASSDPLTWDIQGQALGEMKAARAWGLLGTVLIPSASLGFCVVIV